MRTKNQFERWYGCDEVNRESVFDAVVSKLGTHVWVEKEIVSPVDDEAFVNDFRAAVPGLYVLRTMSAWADPRNGRMPYIVAAWFDRVAGAKSAEDHLSLLAMEASIEFRPVP